MKITGNKKNDSYKKIKAEPTLFYKLLKQIHP